MTGSTDVGRDLTSAPQTRITASLGEWAALALAPQELVPARHHLKIIAELEGLEAGRWDRLMLLLPPGSAKSTYTSLLFPPWFFARHPRASIIAASHTASLAMRFGRGVRGLIREHAPALGVALDPASRSAGQFDLASGGSYFATGVRGPVTGRRADLLIIDDPIKNQREADSAVARDHLWEWFRSDLVTRLRPGGRMVLVMTRWHPDDLGGRLLTSSDDWRVLRLPALAEEGDPLGREPGRALWPEWEDEEALSRKALMLGDRTFSALFQQSPEAPGGRLFIVKHLAVVDDVLAGRSVRAWDLAASGRGGDWTVGVRLCRSDESGFQVTDVVRIQGGPEKVLKLITGTAAADGRQVAIGLPQDPGQAGKSQVLFLTDRLAGYHVKSSPESGSKTRRAAGVVSQANVGNVSLLRGSWNQAFIEELQDFPGGAKDDQVDALSRAFDMLTPQEESSRRMQVSLFGR